MKIKITQINGEIGVRSTPARVHIHQSLPRFRMNQEPAEMIIQNVDPKLIIDQTEANADMGNKTISRLMNDFAKLCYDISMEAIGEISSEGTRISKAGKARSEIVRQIIIEKMTEDRSEVNIASHPREGPDIRWEKGHLEITWKIHMPEMEWEVVIFAEVDFEPYSVEIYMRKYPSLSIEVFEKDSEHKRAEKVNRKI